MPHSLLRLGLAVFVLAMTGCEIGVPVSATSKVELAAASESPSDQMVAMRLANTDRDVYVARHPLLTNNGISKVERAYDDDGTSSVVLHFTEDGRRAIEGFTTPPDNKMIALVVDGSLILALNVGSPIQDRARISGNRSEPDTDRLFRMLTGTADQGSRMP